MCMVSVITDYGRTQVPEITWTTTTFNEYQEILRRLEELDRKLGQPACEDPVKAAWMEDVEKRLQQLEKSQNLSKVIKKHNVRT